MGLIKAAVGAAGGVLADQWKEYFYSDALESDVLAVKGQRRVSGRSSNTKGENVISNGSVVAVASGQAMMIVDNGKIVEFCAEPGEYVFDNNAEPSIFTGDLKESVKDTFKNMMVRFTFGGSPGRDQRVYYFNTKEMFGNKYGTPSPVPFKIIDDNIGLNLNVNIRCFGEYTYRITDPMLFYQNVCGNVEQAYTREEIDAKMKAEVMHALQPALARIALKKIHYEELPLYTVDIANELNDILSQDWRERRGIEMESFSIASVKALEEDEAMLKELQRNAVFRNTDMAAAHLVGAQAEAMQAAAANTSAGPAMAFMGMGMAGAAGGANANQLFQQNQFQQQQQMQQMAAQQPAPGSWTCPTCNISVPGNFCPQCGMKKPEPKPAAGSWTCPTCNIPVSGNFCPECGMKKPEAKPDGWTCPSCGAVNKGKFCSECGAKKPEAAPTYRCNKCGWVPEDPAHPPKFCPECGDPMNEEDIQ